MPAFSDEEILRYATGRADPSLAAAIRERSAVDDDLREVVDLWRLLAGPGDPPSATATGNTPPGVSGRPARLRRWSISQRLLAAAILLLAAGTVVGGWRVLAARPLVSDDFRDGWFDSDMWLPPPAVEQGGVREERGHVRLVNRGYLVPRREFDGPVVLTFEWKWAQLGLDPLYSDHLTVALRTTGVASGKRPYEVRDGVLIKFDAWGGFIRALTPETPDLKTIASTQEGDNPLTLPLPAEAWHKIKITDDGTTIAVYTSGPEIPEKFWETPVLQVRPEGKAKGRRFAIYNREMVGDSRFPRESFIRNLELRRLR